jgi:hypothetical protein
MLTEKTLTILQVDGSSFSLSMDEPAATAMDWSSAAADQLVLSQGGQLAIYEISGKAMRKLCSCEDMLCKETDGSKRPLL